MKKKNFKVGMIVGRFQPFHKGHEYLVNLASSMCETVVIVVGSAQEAGTPNNPLSYEFREELISTACREICNKNKAKIIIVALKDMSHPENHTPMWGEYVLASVKASLLYNRLESDIDIIFYGNEPKRSNWYSDEKREYISEFLISRDKFPFSGRFIRKMILDYGEEIILNDKDFLPEVYSSEQRLKICKSVKLANEGELA